MRNRVVVAVVVVGCGLGLAGCTPDESAAEQDGKSVIAPGEPGESNRTLSPEEAQKSATEEEPNAADFSYIEMMIVHHQQAIEMTELATKQADGKQVKGIAGRIAAAQGPEIKMMNTWLADHGEKPVEHGGHGDAHGDMPGMASAEEMKELADARGAKFDRLFLKLMIAHHEGALTMARDIQVKGSHLQVQEMADDVIATQAAEIDRMRRMLEN